jgi:cobalamin biosynthetic protein CobC
VMNLTTLLAPRLHGGDLDFATETYGLPSDGWIDLSTGISPYPYDMPEISSEAWRQLPSKARQTALATIALKAYGAGESAHISCAPGTQALINVLPKISDGIARVAVVSPTYSEHAASWSRHGHQVQEVMALPNPDQFDVVVITNPNNPDGRLFSRGDLITLADDLGARDGILIIDECFADALPHCSLVSEAGYRALIILRSFGKFFGFPGLRLGFALAPLQIVSRLDDLLGPWPISGAAIEIGVKALSDINWIEAARLRLAERARRLDAVVNKGGLNIIGGTPLFRLIECTNALRVHKSLARQGIWTRIFSANSTWLRLGIPGSDRELAKLEHALKHSYTKIGKESEVGGD